MITAALRKTEELEKPLKEEKEGAARLRGRTLGSPEGPRTTELDRWLSRAQLLGPGGEKPDSGFFNLAKVIYVP